MLSRLRLPISALVLVGVFVSLNSHVWRNRVEVRQTTPAGYVMPSKFSRVFALGYDGLLADYLTLKAMTFFGERVMHQQAMRPEDWDYLEAMLKTVTDLDPYFRDPYMLAEGLLAWEARRIEVVNRLLEKAWNHHPEFWEFPFYIGFNYFYFLDEPGIASDYLMEASRLPGSPNFLPGLAARLTVDASQTRMGIVFLKGLMAQTEDKALKSRYRKRLRALESIALLENAVQRYKENENGVPEKVQRLLEKGYIDEIPPEPYGGQWYIDAGGKIRSTSRLTDSPDSRK